MSTAPSAFFAPEALDRHDPGGVVTACIESGAGSLLLDAAALPSEFFDLSSGVLGAVVHKTALYDIRMAVVVPDLSRYSEHFQNFVREANRGRLMRFVASRDEALSWLSNDRG